jgi:spore coat polysaccharide biosynthesis predicted glycosyltransferase SpsG
VNRKPKSSNEPTEKQVTKDFNALLHGKKDGEVEIENKSGHFVGGKHEVIDETFKKKCEYRETREGEVE